MTPWMLVSPKCQEKYFAVTVYLAIVFNFSSCGKDSKKANFDKPPPGDSMFADVKQAE